MSQIADLEHRITAALDRVSQGVEKIEARTAQAPPASPPEPQADPGELAQLREALEEEKLANAQLEERLRKLRERHRDELAAAQQAAQAQPSGESGSGEAAVDIAALEDEMQRLRKANEMLRATNEELRAALAENVGEPHLINKAMLAELEGLRAARAVEAAEAQAVLASLTPLLDAAANGAGAAPQAEDQE